MLAAAVADFSDSLAAHLGADPPSMERVVQGLGRDWPPPINKCGALLSWRCCGVPTSSAVGLSTRDWAAAPASGLGYLEARSAMVLGAWAKRLPPEQCSLGAPFRGLAATCCCQPRSTTSPSGCTQEPAHPLCIRGSPWLLCCRAAAKLVALVARQEAWLPCSTYRLTGSVGFTLAALPQGCCQAGGPGGAPGGLAAAQHVLHLVPPHFPNHCQCGTHLATMLQGCRQAGGPGGAPGGLAAAQHVLHFRPGAHGRAQHGQWQRRAGLPGAAGPGRPAQRAHGGCAAPCCVSVPTDVSGTHGKPACRLVHA